MAWLPMESNPDVMNRFLERAGVPKKWQIVDVFGLDPDLLAVIPRPALALILLFPCNDKYESLRLAQEAAIKEKGQEVSDQVFYMKQYMSNACGTVALIHSVANNTDLIQLGDGSIKQFIEDTVKLDPEARGRAFVDNLSLAAVHNEIAVEGQTQPPSSDDPVIHHFAAFVHKDGTLYELDGRKAFPINHGPTSADTFVEDAAKVIDGIIKEDPDEVRFTVVALTAQEE